MRLGFVELAVRRIWPSRSINMPPSSTHPQTTLWTKRSTMFSRGTATSRTSSRRLRPSRFAEQGCGGAAGEDAYSRGGVHGFCAGVEGMILHSVSCRCQDGASHRKECGHVTPKLGTAERQTALRCLRKLTSAASPDLVAQGMTAVSNDDVCLRQSARSIDHVNALKRKNFV